MFSFTASISNRTNNRMEVFYFRDEESISSNAFVSQVFSDSLSSDDDLDDEFILLDAEVGVGYLVSKYRECSKNDFTGYKKKMLKGYILTKK